MKLNVFFALIILLVSSCKQETKVESEVNVPTIETTVDVEEVVSDTHDIEEVNTTELLNQITSGKLDFQFYVSITEPFWTFYFLEDKAVLYGMDNLLKYYQFDQPFDASKDSQTIVITNGDEERIFVINRGEGSDGMSDIVYPYDVTLDNEWHGGGATEYMKESYE